MIAVNEKLFPNLKKMTTIFCIAIAVITVGFLLVRLLVFGGATPKAPGAPTTNTSDVAVPDDLNIELSDKLTFANPTEVASLRVKIAKEQEEKVGIRILRNDDNKEIYKSPQLSAGDRKLNVMLSRSDMPKGTYNCTAEITTYDPVTQQPLGTYTRNITVVIKEDAPTA